MQATTRQLTKVILAVISPVSVTYAQTATAPAGPESAPTAVLIPAEGPIEWHLTVETLERTIKAAAALKPQFIIFEINSPGGVVQYTWDMINQFKVMPDCKTIAWVNGKLNGAFSSGAILALGCDRIYIAPGQAIGAAVPYNLDTKGIPRDVSLKWTSAWHAQLRALCEMKSRPWAVVYALASTNAGLYKVKTPDGCQYVNYEKIRPLLSPGLVTELDVVRQREADESGNVNLSGSARTNQTRTVRRQAEGAKDPSSNSKSVSVDADAVMEAQVDTRTSGTYHIRTVTSRRSRHTDGLPAGVEVVCSVGEVLTLTSREAVECGLADGVADSVEQILQEENTQPAPRIVTLADPVKQSNQTMDGVTRAFLTSLAAVGGSVRASTGRGRSSEQRLLYLPESKLGDGRLLAEYRKLKALVQRYPDLVTSPATVASIDASIQRLQNSLQQKREQERKARQEDLKHNRPAPGVSGRLGWQ